MQAHVYEWLPAISRMFHGAITPLNVYDVTLDMWLLYVAAAEALVEEQKQQARKARR